MEELTRNLETFRDKVELLLKSDARLDESTGPSVTVMHDDMGGTLNVTSFMKREISEMLRDTIGDKMESDVFMLTCSGVFKMDDKAMKLNCSIVNEDGISVNVYNDKKMNPLNEFIHKTRYEIFNIFKSI